MKKTEVENFNTFKSVQKLRTYFLRKVGHKEWFSEQSFLQYLRSVKSVMRYVGCKDPDEVIEKLRENSEEATRLVNNWVGELNLKGWAPLTQNHFAACLKRFLTVNEVVINWNKVTLPKTRYVVQDKAPNKHELRRILMYAPSWLKAVILILATSGLRIGSLIRLNLKHVNFNYDEAGQIALIEVPPEASKTRVGYYTFTGLEAIDVLKKHLKTRENGGEQLTEESPLIKPPKSPRLTYTSARVSYNRTLKRAGLTKKSSGYFVLHLHSLRKYFRTNLEAVLTKSQIERLMGHISTEYLDGSYFRPPERDMLENYRRALVNLIILEDVQSEEFQKKQLLRQAALILPEEKIRRLKDILARAKTIDEAIQEFKRFKEEPETMTNGNGEYVVVQGEGELLHRLENGWKLVQALNGDKYLLQHP